MINLYSVKLNNNYDYIQLAEPTGTAGQTWLKTDGTDYLYTTSWVQQNLGSDVKIENAINKTIANTLEWLNNHFYVDSNGIYADWQNFDNSCNCADANEYINLYDDSLVYEATGKITTTETIEFVVDDLIQIRESERNKGIYGYITEVNAADLTLNNALRAYTGYGLLMLIQIPSDVEDIISKMIWFDVLKRDLTQAGDVTSEREGSYSVSYSLDGDRLNGLQYPSSITTGLKQYRIARIMN